MLFVSQLCEISQNEMRKRFFLRHMELLKHIKLKRLLKRMFPNRIIKVTDNPDKSQTISIL